MVVGVDDKNEKVSKHKSGKLIAVAAVFSIGAYLWFFWFQTAMLIETGYIYRHIPVARMIPVQLTDHHVAPGEGSKLSCFGYDFEVPWNDVDTQNIHGKAMLLIPFRSGLEILVGHGSTHDLVDTAMRGTQTDPQSFRTAYGDKAAQSDYEFLKLALNTTPGSIRLADSKKDVVSKSTLLMFKTLIVPGNSGIFEVQANEFMGFQYGDPSKHPKRVTVSLYSGDGGIELSFSQKNLGPLAISQADINRAIQTLCYRRLAGTSQQ